MNNEVVFRTSKKALFVWLLLAFILCFIIIGFFLAIAVILKYKFSSLSVSKAGVTFKGGILTKNIRTIPFNKINSVDIRVFEPYSFWRYGTVEVTTGNDLNGIRFIGLEDPRRFKELVERFTA